MSYMRPGGDIRLEVEDLMRLIEMAPARVRGKCLSEAVRFCEDAVWLSALFPKGAGVKAVGGRTSWCITRRPLDLTRSPCPRNVVQGLQAVQASAAALDTSSYIAANHAALEERSNQEKTAPDQAAQ